MTTNLTAALLAFKNQNVHSTFIINNMKGRGQLSMRSIKHSLVLSTLSTLSTFCLLVWWFNIVINYYNWRNKQKLEEGVDRDEAVSYNVTVGSSYWKRFRVTGGLVQALNPKSCSQVPPVAGHFSFPFPGVCSALPQKMRWCFYCILQRKCKSHQSWRTWFKLPSGYLPVITQLYMHHYPNKHTRHNS